MKRITIFSSLVVCALGQIANAAVPIEEIRKYDVDQDGLLDQDELASLARIKNRFSGNQHTRYQEGVSANMPMPVSVFTEVDGSNACEPTQRFFLQHDVTRFSLLNQNVVGGSDKSARFSFTDDKTSGATNWSVEGAIAYLPKVGGRCLTSDDKRGKPHAVLSGFAIAPYLSFKGSGSSTVTGTSNLALGVLGQFQFFGGIFNLQNISARAFARTDFDGDAEIYGLGASWTPYHVKSRLNVRPTGTDPANFWWTLGADAEFLHVKKAGQSGLTTGQQYGWVSARIGVGYEFPVVAKGAFVRVDYSASHDVVNDLSAYMGEARFGLYLDQAKRNTLELTYEKGRDRDTLTQVDAVTLNLGFAF